MNRDEIAADMVLELPLGDAAPNFNLEKAVCSHGLFMMAPNHWDSRSKTLKRPLRLGLDDGGKASFMVHISHPHHSDYALHLRVLGTPSLSPHHQQSLLSQVRRMLRLSVEENKRVKEFQEVHEEAKCRAFGRVFRSPTLFEDMVKCILLCNCQWSRTLSMAQALCELQFELQHPSSAALNVITDKGSISGCQMSESKHFAPKTPARKESKRTSRVGEQLKILTKMNAQVLPVQETEITSEMDEMLECSLETGKTGPNFALNGAAGYASTITGNFPSPQELARLDEEFLARRCNLGYRAARVINLARGIIEGRIQLDEFEVARDMLSSADYDNLFVKLRAIDGFGPFTCANVLMCIGFYHVIPTDSETIRHLKQVHARSSTMQTVQEDVEDIYGKYTPFQFLAYWSEVWHFYEEWFGNLSEMPHSNYRLITAANMKPKKPKHSRRKKIKVSRDESGNEA